MKNYIQFLLAFFPLTLFATKSADDIIAAASAKMSSSPSVEAVFTIYGSDEKIQGSLIMAGTSFVMSTPQLKVWYDGVDQWSLIMSAQEVNITRPSMSEILETNPFAILKHYSDYYSARRLPDNNGQNRVQLTPLRPSESNIIEAVVQFFADGYPAAIEVVFIDQHSLKVDIDQISPSAQKPTTTFKYDSKLYPQYEVIDLR